MAIPGSAFNNAAPKPPEHGALLYAAKCGDTVAVAALLGRGADIDEKDDGGRTALIWAAQFNFAGVIRLLLDNGTNIDERSDEGDTALIMAATCGSTEAARLLVEREADINKTDNSGHTALQWATSCRYREIETLLRDVPGYLQRLAEERAREQAAATMAAAAVETEKNICASRALQKNMPVPGVIRIDRSKPEIKK